MLNQYETEPSLLGDPETLERLGALVCDLVGHLDGAAATAA